eukprot:355058-Chlamydomonas_euryale.AAC.1
MPCHPGCAYATPPAADLARLHMLCHPSRAYATPPAAIPPATDQLPYAASPLQAVPTPHRAPSRRLP